MTGWIVPAMVGLLPVLGFLGALVAIDSRKLVRLSTVIAVVAAGAAVAGTCYAGNAWLIGFLDLDLNFTILHWYPMTLSIGYAIGFGDGRRSHGEWMASLKIM